MARTGSEMSTMFIAYGYIGAIFGSISMCSAAVFYAFGPGAIWNLGVVECFLGLFVATGLAFFRVAIWPYGVYVLITNPDAFLRWLFYLWYQ